MSKTSVVIPTKNRAALLAEAIDHIESQTIPREQYELIVIDNDSTDDTRSVIEQKGKDIFQFPVGLAGKTRRRRDAKCRTAARKRRSDPVHRR
jgi:glycosyltransferase involved in cell wall biosynthesis